MRSCSLICCSGVTAGFRLAHSQSNVQGPISERINGIGSVSDSLINAMRAVLKEEGADGAFVAAAISLPTVSELIDAVEGADPLLLHAVRCRYDPYPT